jgi:hypothetical protein
MRSFPGSCATIALAAALLAPAITGCAVHARVYDPYYHDYHSWDADSYARWEHDSHHNHEDFKNRNKDEQKEYWDWQHNQH